MELDIGQRTATATLSIVSSGFSNEIEVARKVAIRDFRSLSSTVSAKDVIWLMSSSITR
jgi:hypothetical protein